MFFRIRFHDIEPDILRKRFSCQTVRRKKSPVFSDGAGLDLKEGEFSDGSLEVAADFVPFFQGFHLSVEELSERRSGIVEQYDLRDVVGTFPSDSNGDVVLGSGGVFIEEVIPLLKEQFRKRTPEVRFEIRLEFLADFLFAADLREALDKTEFEVSGKGYGYPVLLCPGEFARNRFVTEVRIGLDMKNDGFPYVGKTVLLKMSDQALREAFGEGFVLCRHRGPPFFGKSAIQ